MNIKNLILVSAFFIIAVATSSCGMKRALTLPPKEDTSTVDKSDTKKSDNKPAEKKATNQPKNDQVNNDAMDDPADQDWPYDPNKPKPKIQPIWPSAGPVMGGE